MDVEHEGVRQSPDLQQVLIRNSSLAQRHDNASRQAENDGDSGRHSPALPSRQLEKTVSHRVRTRHHRLMSQVAAKISGELLHGWITPLRILLERSQQDFVQSPP